jgi:hypothetical protein
MSFRRRSQHNHNRDGNGNGNGNRNSNSMSNSSSHVAHVFGRSIIRNRNTNKAASASASASAVASASSPTPRAATGHSHSHTNRAAAAAAAAATTTDPSICVICMEDLKGRLGVANPCGHVFHQECYGTWDMQRFGGNNNDTNDSNSSSEKHNHTSTKCPTCRRSVDMFTHIHESVGNLHFGEMIDIICIDPSPSPTNTTNVNDGNLFASRPHAISRASSEDLSSFVQSCLAHVRGGGEDDTMEEEYSSSSLCAHTVSDLQSQIKSLESILQSAQEHQKASLLAAQSEQEHLTRGMLDLSLQNENLQKSLKDSHGTIQTLTQENDRLRHDLEEGRTLMNDMFSATATATNSTNSTHSSSFSSSHNHATADNNTNNPYHPSWPYDYHDDVHSKRSFT